jgi:hypothetical protein
MIQRGSANGYDLPGDGAYLKDFDFEAFNGQGSIALTLDIQKAKRFFSLKEAFDYVRTSPKTKPFREDGQPNRPLTASNWEFQTIFL